MNILGKIAEWLFPSLREMRIEGEMADGGEDTNEEGGIQEADMVYLSIYVS